MADRRPGGVGGAPRGGSRARGAVLAALTAAAALAGGCDPAPSPPSAPAASAPPPAPQAALPAAVTEPAASPGASSANPLGLPPRRVHLEPRRRVFTFSDRMLAGAKLGSTLVLYAATVVGFEGDDLIIEGRGGPSYRVHAGYVIPVPDAPRLRPRDPVLTEWNGVMKHAVVTRFIKDRVEVRYTDMDARTPEGQLKGARFVRQAEGLRPGNYAALKEGDGFRHVLLVSRLGDAAGGADEPPVGAARWFALGYGGAALLADEAALVPMPIQPKLKVGAAVWAEWVGALRPAVVQSVEETGLFTVKFERAGRPVTLGWGLITPPLRR